MSKKLTPQDLQTLFELACDYRLTRNWDDAIAAEMKAQDILAGYEAWFPIWRDFIDYLELFYRENRRAMTIEEAAAWLKQAGLAEITE